MLKRSSLSDPYKRSTNLVRLDACNLVVHQVAALEVHVLGVLLRSVTSRRNDLAECER